MEKKQNELRVKNILQLIKIGCLEKSIHPFDLFTQYDPEDSEFQVANIFELDLALQQIEVKVDKSECELLFKVFNIPNTKNLATMKMCSWMVDDLVELVMLAINYMIQKYKILHNIFFFELANEDKIFNFESLRKVNTELQWFIEPDKLERIYDAMTQNG